LVRRSLRAKPARHDVGDETPALAMLSGIWVSGTPKSADPGNPPKSY
jgi:hypothetical protein